jgi:hypothetical protein
MAYINRAYRVCERLANTSGEQVWRPQLFDIPDLDSCKLAPVPDSQFNNFRVIVRHPDSDPRERYLLIEADSAHINKIADSIELFEVQHDRYDYFYPSGPMRPEDIIFWANTSDFPKGWLLEEFALVDVDDNTNLSDLNNFIPPEVRHEKQYIASSTDPTQIRFTQTNDTLARFGYWLKLEKVSGTGSNLFELYHHNELKVNNIRGFHNPSISASGNDFVMVIEVFNDGYRLVQKDSLTRWIRYDRDVIVLHDPIFYGEQLLIPYWENMQIVVKLGGKTIFTYAPVFGAKNPVDDLWTWDDHWMLLIHDTLFQDGQNMNEIYSLEEIYNWKLIDGKPFYLFRKGPRVGIKYDGKVLPFYYDDIYHYGCCGLTHLNPTVYGNTLWFYAIHDEVWFHAGLTWATN